MVGKFWHPCGLQAMDWETLCRKFMSFTKRPWADEGSLLGLKVSVERGSVGHVTLINGERVDGPVNWSQAWWGLW